jgi:hypothetical protein
LLGPNWQGVLLGQRIGDWPPHHTATLEEAVAAYREALLPALAVDLVRRPMEFHLDVLAL